MGRAFAQRLVTQMYFPGDPLFPYDPIFNSIPDPAARERLVSRFDDPRRPARTGRSPTSWTSILRGPGATPFEEAHVIHGLTPSQTVGPYFAIGLPWPTSGRSPSPEARPARSRSRGTIYDGAGEPIPDFLLETWQADPDGRFADLCGYGGASELDGFRGFARYRPRGRRRDVRAPHRQARAGVACAAAASRRRTSTSRVFARGMLHRCVTRIYFADEERANAADPVLARVPADASRTLLAQPIDGRLPRSTSASRARTRPSSSPSELPQRHCGGDSATDRGDPS